jgi:hypothetical protein
MSLQAGNFELLRAFNKLRAINNDDLSKKSVLLTPMVTCESTHQKLRFVQVLREFGGGGTGAARQIFQVPLRSIFTENCPLRKCGVRCGPFEDRADFQQS